MKNLNKFVSIALCSSLLGGMAFAQQTELGRNPNVRLLESTQQSVTKVQFRMDNLKFTEVQTPKGMAQVPTYTEGVNLSEKGMPTLPILSRSLAVSDTREMKVEVVSSKFIEKKNVLIAPSKGMIMRNEDPKKIPYVYGKSYSQNKFFPGEIATLDDPFILRDVRGQVVNFAPLQYNPVTKTLRIYTEITVAVSETSEQGKNILNKKGTFAGFEDTYKRMFMNYEPGRYTPVEEKQNGRMIVIVAKKYEGDIKDFVDWKNQRGLRTEVKVAEDIASPVTANAIQQFVKQEYEKEGNDLTYVLLVGDHKDIPAKITPGIKSDQVYGQIVGNDHYNEVFIGRFSCESKEDLKTQIDRTIHYERNITTEDKWLGQALCIASAEGGPSADNGESDIQHENVIANLLTQYGYTKIIKCYDPGVTPKNIIDAFNGGISLVNYTGHGSETAWGTSHFGTTHVKQLTNSNQLPFIFDVACVNGDFLFSMPCFAEALMRAQKDGKPTGTVAIIASTINQSWASPMRGQDEMNEILCEKHPNNIKRTFGGVTMNGMFAMVEKYKKDGEKMLDTWTVFGDPSLLVRTLVPTKMQVTAPAQINLTDASVNVSCDYNGAIATISANGKMFGSAVVENGTATINLTGLTNESTLTLTVVGYNKETVIKTINTNGEPNPYQPVSNLTATTQGQKVTLKWDAPSTKTNATTNTARSVDGIRELVLLSVSDAPELLRSGQAEIVLEAHDVWNDGSGYQILLDADHDQYGQVIPSDTHTLWPNCSVPANLFAPFEYTVPENADPSCSPTNMIMDGTASVNIPAGTYDFAIAAPQANAKIWIAGQGPTKEDDYVFEAGKKYHFLMKKMGSGDGTELTISEGGGSDYTYTVYRDGTKIKEGLTATTFEEDGVAAGNHEYCVEVKYTAGVSPKVCKDVTVEGSNEFAPVQNLTGSAVGQKVMLKWDAPNGTPNPNPNPNPNPGTTTLSESFENGIPASWKTIDADGDGHGWKPGNAPGIAGYNSNGCVYSESFGLGGIGVLTPDNYLITPALDLPNGGKLTFWVCAQDANYASEHYAVYASSTGNDASNFTNALLEETITAKGVRSPEAIRGRIQGTWRQKTVDLPAGTKYVAFRHFQSTDMFYIDLDEVEIKANGKRADFTETFESSTHGEAPAEWTTIDADGDGQGWLCLSSGQLGWLTAHGGTNVVASFSWNGMALNPDNYLISKDVTGATKVKYYYAVNDGFPGDHYAVMISKTGTNAGDFTVVFEETPNGINKGGARFDLSTEADGAKPQSVWIERTVDLPAGTKYVAFRHYNCSDLNYILLDDIQFTMGGSPTPTDYTYTVYRDGTKIKEGLTETTFEEDGVATGNHEYCVEVKYTAGVSPKKCVNVTVNSTQFNPVKNLKAQPDGGDVVLKWEAPSAKKTEGSREVKRIGDGLFVTIEPANDVRANEAKVVLAADNVWGDNTGYQFLLDADHNTFGSVIPATGPLFTGTASSNLYSANFEYLIPANADPVVTTQNIIVTGQGEVVIPGGVYDYCITNPEPASGKMWIAGDGGNQPARYDDFTFEAGKKYTFTMRRAGMGDGTDMEVEDDSPASYTYTVYRDGTKIKEGLTETTYRDAGMSAQSHEYCVEVKYAAGVSPKVCVDYIPDGVADVTAQKPYTLTVVGKTITVTCQGEAMIYDMNGRRLAAGRNTVVYTAQGGYYAVMVVVDGKSYVEKLAVK
ncbi:arginine-specific cysteine protease RgpA [Porphyromonas gingivalis]|uniref:Arg-gingipain RgpA n=1 Tax=Porphyromonas gingivalis TaxID=837 RepID=UPI0009750540|nr:Arg-gingipain RgpA [Porphyromonas gingivalis]SJL26388.1 arginine-specific cysteine protease RgpA [Porphyromonas gingivalis]